MGLHVAVMADRVEEQQLFPVAQFLVPRLVIHADDLVRRHEISLGRQHCVVHAQCGCSGVAVHIRRLRLRFLHGDRNRSLGPDHVLHEEGRLAHHRSPAGLVPADRPIIEAHVQVAIVVHPGVDFRGEPGAHRMHADGLRARHLAHHVHIMHAAIDDGADRIHQVPVHLPLRAGGLLVEVHAHDQRLSQRSSHLHELHPGRMNPQDIADHQLQALGLGEGRDVLGLRHRLGQRLLDEHVCARLQRHAGIGGMGVGPGVDRHGIGLQRGQRLRIVVELRHAREFRRQLFALGNVAAAQARDLEAIDRLVGPRMAQPHVAQPHDQHANVRHCPLIHVAFTRRSSPSSTRLARWPGAMRPSSWSHRRKEAGFSAAMRSTEPSSIPSVVTQ